LKNGFAQHEALSKKLYLHCQSRPPDGYIFRLRLSVDKVVLKYKHQGTDWPGAADIHSMDSYSSMGWMRTEFVAQDLHK
jgi:hypothetical protein